MQNMGMNGRVLKTVDPDGEFASLVNHAYGLSYGENYSLVQENSHKYMKKPTLPDGQHIVHSLDGYLTIAVSR